MEIGQADIQCHAKRNGTRTAVQTARDDLYHIVLLFMSLPMLIHACTMEDYISSQLTTLAAAKLVLLKTSFSEENAASLL